MDDAGKRIIYLYRDSSYRNILGDNRGNLLSAGGKAEIPKKQYDIPSYRIPILGGDQDSGGSQGRKVKA